MNYNYNNKFEAPKELEPFLKYGKFNKKIFGNYSSFLIPDFDIICRPFLFVLSYHLIRVWNIQT